MESCRIGNLPEELFHEILLRLPVKALLVCKCVRKDWCALIKSPSFVNRHFNHESNQECLVFNGMHTSEGRDDVAKGVCAMYEDERHSLADAPDILRQMPGNMITEGLENGIFCLRLTSCLALFNPATREFKKLPPIPDSDRRVFNDRPWIGCGSDPSTGDFKVIAFLQNMHWNYACVYNLSSDSWKTVETIDSYDIIGYRGYHGIPTLNGVKHWLTKRARTNVYSILAFDMRSDKFQNLALPDALVETESVLGITTYCDSVAVLSYIRDECVDLWVMGGDGLWSKSFSLGMITSDLAFHQTSVVPLLVWKKNKVFLSESSNLIICDVSTQKVSTLQAMDPASYFSSCFVYKESLVSIKGKILVTIRGDSPLQSVNSLLGWFYYL